MDKGTTRMSEKHEHQHLSQHDQNLHDFHDNLDHIVSPRIYVIVGATLLVFTGITVWASFLELGVFNPIVALFIAEVEGIIREKGLTSAWNGTGATTRFPSNTARERRVISVPRSIILLRSSRVPKDC